MKKLLISCIALILIIPAILLGDRYNSNRSSLVPYPFVIETTGDQSDIDAPILIVGDMMAKRLSTFAKNLSTKISGDIQTPIEVASIAADEEGLHRTLDKIKKLKRLPFVIIYLGNLDNSKEMTFYNKNMQTILKNFELYEDPMVQSILMMVQELSRFIYFPIKYTRLGDSIAPDENLTKGSDSLYQQRMRVNFKLYEALIDDLFRYISKANSFIIPVTSPLNLKVKPNKSCYGSFDEITHEDYKKVIQLIKKKDYKSAYNLSKDLVLINSAHASSQYLHGLASEKINKYAEAQKHFELARALDCGNTKNGHPVYNVILKKAANKHGFSYLDYHQYMVDQSRINHTFIDEFYPQDFYLDKLTDMLALRIKKLLKLN